MATSTALSRTCCAATGPLTAAGWQRAARTALCTSGMQVRHAAGHGIDVVLALLRHGIIVALTLLRQQHSCRPCLTAG
jgi:hypothetical protein